jgi:AcrR family transcriptional regulator
VQRSTPDTSRAPHLGPERRRPSILDAALDIAATKGIAAVSIAAVAEHLGVTRPVVYACFTDRTDLLTALAGREEQVVLEGALAAMTGAQAGGFEKRNVAGFQALLAFVADHPESWRLLFQDTPEPALRDAFGRGRTRIGIEFERLVADTLRERGVADLDRKLPVLTELFLSSCEAAVRLLLDDGQDWSPDDLGLLVGSAVHHMLRNA